METAALIELPHWLVENGFSKIAAGVEVPIDYNKELPESYKIAELPECIMLHFQSGPYENKEDFSKAIESTNQPHHTVIKEKSKIQPRNIPKKRIGL